MKSHKEGSSRKIDLHAHTTASDGTLSPGALIQSAAAAGLSAVAVTDHDSVAGHEEALAAGARLRVEVIPGVELSADAGDRDVHVLGYFVPRDDATFAARLQELRRRRMDRAQRMVDRLRSAGVDIRMEDVLQEAAGDAIGRPHVARALLRIGTVKTVGEAFMRYIGRDGSCFVPKTPFPVAEAIGALLEARALPVIAHPALIGDDSLLDTFVAAGMRGIEVWHPDHDPGARARYRAFARSHGLVMTGGSDFHGASAGHRGDLGS